LILQISIHFTDRFKPIHKSHIPSESWVNKIANLIFPDFNLVAEELNLIYMSDSEILDLNQKFLNHDDYTDIITFDLRDEPDSKISAELYMSSDRISENSVINKVRTEDEFKRVIIHGFLHLCGLNDKSASEKNEMRVKEDYYLNTI
jgi:probable rRNA maturation factor